MHTLLQFLHGFIWGSLLVYLRISDHLVLFDIVAIAFPLMVSFYLYKLQNIESNIESSELRKLHRASFIVQEKPNVYKAVLDEDNKLKTITADLGTVVLRKHPTNSKE